MYSVNQIIKFMTSSVPVTITCTGKIITGCIPKCLLKGTDCMGKDKIDLKDDVTLCGDVIDEYVLTKLNFLKDMGSISYFGDEHYQKYEKF